MARDFKMGNIITDLDGTLALIDHRRHYVEGEKKDWDAFYKACPDDTLNKPVANILSTMYQAGYDIHIFSGRSEMVREETKVWLATNLKYYTFPVASLVMRDENDYTPDDELKYTWLQWFIKFHGRPYMVFDDRNKVVEMWRNQGIPTFQVADGNF